MSEPRITAIICSYNRYRTIGASIESLTRQTLSKDRYEIIVVDNSPDHANAEKFGRQFLDIPNLTWLVEKTPGLSNARNVGVQHAKGEIAAFIDDDAVADPAWLEEILETFDSFGERASAVGGQVEPIWEGSRPDWLHEDFLGYLSVVNWGGVARVAGPREWLAGTNIAFRVNDLRKVGGFSTGLGRVGSGYTLISNEETDVCERLKAQGQIVVYAPDAKVGHRAEPERLTQEWFRRRVVWQAVSDYLREGATLFGQAPKYWTSVTQFVNVLPPINRSLRALYVPIDDAAMFKSQMGALYNYTIAMLAGFHGVEA